MISLLALAAQGREPLPEALERFATADPSLNRWRSAIAMPLRQGSTLANTLRRARVIDRSEASMLERPGADAARVLERLAKRAALGPTGVTLVRWYPVWLACAALLPSLILARLFDLLTGGFYRNLVNGLGISLNGLTEAVVGPWWIAMAFGLGIPLTIAVGMAALREFRGLRHVLHLWCPEVHRCHLAVKLLRHAATLESSTTARWWQTWLGWLRIGSIRNHRPVWDADWRAWRFLVFFRLTKSDRRLLGELSGLSERLRAIGLLAPGDRWEASYALAEERLDRAVLAAKPLLVAYLMLIAMIGVTVVGLSPLIKIFQALSAVGDGL